MDLKTLLSLFMVYRSNFHVLHWNAKGEKFDRVHALAADYYDKLLSDADIIAEMSMRIGQGVVNYPEAYDTLKTSNNNYLIIPSDTLYDYNAFIKMCDTMLKDILHSIESALENPVIKEPSNVGIKATLESMHNEYDLQCRYLNARRM